MNKLQNKDIKVAIIGGGFAGLSAFRRLNSLGANHVDLFEASNRLGGRVFPIPFGILLNRFNLAFYCYRRWILTTRRTIHGN